MMVTFDQSLNTKAREMVAAAPDNSPLKSQHVALSSIGFIMVGNGLEELYGLVYAKNCVQK